jgi:hypothetical protein
MESPTAVFRPSDNFGESSDIGETLFEISDELINSANPLSGPFPPSGEFDDSAQIAATSSPDLSRDLGETGSAKATVAFDSCQIGITSGPSPSRDWGNSEGPKGTAVLPASADLRASGPAKPTDPFTASRTPIVPDRTVSGTESRLDDPPSHEFSPSPLPAKPDDSLGNGSTVTVSFAIVGAIVGLIIVIAIAVYLVLRTRTSEPGSSASVPETIPSVEMSAETFEEGEEPLSNDNPLMDPQFGDPFSVVGLE